MRPRTDLRIPGIPGILRIPGFLRWLPVLLALFASLLARTPRAAPPALQLRILSPQDGTTVRDPTLIVSLAVRAPGTTAPPQIEVIIDGEPVSARGITVAAVQPSYKTEPGERLQRIAVSVPPRDCMLTLRARHGRVQSESVQLRLRWEESGFSALPNLYVLAIGVGAYRRPDLRLLYPAKDASDVAAVFAAQGGRLYSQARVRTLVDAEATQTEILRQLEWLQRQVTARDVAVLFLAGHGINDPRTGEYYFLAHDADPDNVKTTMISRRQLQDTLRNTEGKVLLMIDSCHSGNVFPEWRTRGLEDLQDWTRELASAESGVIVFSAATGRQASKESDRWGNGAFTRALVEGLRGAAVYQSGRPITVGMIEVYVSERVKELTNGSQTPTIAKPASIPDFPLALPDATPVVASAPPPAPVAATPLYKRWWVWAGTGLLLGVIAVGIGVGTAQASADRARYADVPRIVDLKPLQ